MRAVVGGYCAPMHPRPLLPVRIPLSRQRWEDFTFLHWRIDPDVVQERLPAGLEVDTFEGSTWIGVTPFRMADVRPPLLPAPPGLRSFPELNVRTYVRGPAGDGLWFLTLQCTNPLLVAGLRVLGLPYQRARMAVRIADGTQDYTSDAIRVSPAIDVPSTFTATVVPGPPMEPDALDNFLTARWMAYSRVAGRLLATPASHEPWPLTTGEVSSLSSTVLDALDLPVEADDPLVHCASAVHVRIGRPRVVPGNSR